MCVLVFFLCVSQVCAQASSTGPCPDEKSLTPKAKTALAEAQKLITEKKMTQAGKILTQFVSQNPDENHAFVTYTLAACYLDLDKLESALKQYEKTIDFCPVYAPAWQNLAKVCFDLKFYNRAGMALEKAWDLTGRKNHLLRFQAAAAYLSGKEEQKALPILADLCSGKAGPPEDKWVKLFVQISMAEKQPQTALKTVERLLGQPDPKAYLFRLASGLYLDLADYRKAAQNLEAYGLIETLNRQERKLLADLYANLGIPALAADNYQVLVTAHPCCGLWERTAACWFEARDYDKALKAVQKGLEAFPLSCRLWRIKGWIHYEHKEYRPAAQAFGKASGLDHNDINSLFLHGLCAVGPGTGLRPEKPLNRWHAMMGIKPGHWGLSMKWMRKISDHYAVAINHRVENAKSL